jgi:hypothetical protein
MCFEPLSPGTPQKFTVEVRVALQIRTIPRCDCGASSVVALIDRFFLLLVYGHQLLEEANHAGLLSSTLLLN